MFQGLEIFLPSEDSLFSIILLVVFYALALQIPPKDRVVVVEALGDTSDACLLQPSSTFLTSTSNL